MRLIMELAVTTAGRFEGTVYTGAEPPSEFSGTLELLKVLQDATQSDVDAGPGCAFTWIEGTGGPTSVPAGSDV